ncbi:MAG: amidohydrolase family protein, partial [Acidobacteria bacterium]|nr:amidohydrolase family protein [Acidobacteriota bacterium]
LKGMNPPLVPPQNPPLAPRAGSAENGDAPRQRRWKILQANTAALRSAGITFGTGTDAGVTGTHHGWATLRELQLLVAGGLTPMEAITAATLNAAKALHVENERGSIAVGKLADLVLVAGKPHVNIGDIEKVARVFLNGRELDREQMAKDIATIARTPLPARKAVELLDDFERSSDLMGERSAIDTLWVNSSDAGTDASKVLFGRVQRNANDHALSLTARMAEKDRPYARVNLPLSRGAVEPVDARAFRGIRFDVRGAGDYRLLVATYDTRSNASFHAPFQAATTWRTVSIDFVSLKNDSDLKWTGADLLTLSFELSRTAGKFGWLELDNVQFYR